MYKTKELTYYKKFKKTRETQHHPELIDIEITDLTQEGFLETNGTRSILLKAAEIKVLKYIPLLFYDDLLECMLQNLKRLEETNDKILDPSLLFEKNIIFTQKSGDLEKSDIGKYSWWRSFDQLDLDSIVKSIARINKEYILSLEVDSPKF
jgi:hypothetical protein